MIDDILSGEHTQQDIEAARALDSADRKKLIERLLGTLEESFGEALLREAAIDDIQNALAQARPVFAAGLDIDSALGFTTGLIKNSLEDLEQAGAAESDEYDRQQFVLDRLSEFIVSCKETGHTQGEDAQEAVHLEYRGEVAKLEALGKKCEAGIANSLAFLREAYGEGSELEMFGRSLDHNTTCMRYIGKFGSPSFFEFKRITAPGQSMHAPAGKGDDSEGD